jgi:hypothetical protein
VSPLGQEITLTYEPVLYSYLGPVVESMYLNSITNFGSNPCGDGSGGCPDYSAMSGACQYTYTVLGVVLKQIISAQVGKINIDYIGQANSSDSLFSRITVLDSTDSVRKIFDFTYDRVQSTLFSNQFQSLTARDFLKKVSEKSTNNGESKDYSFSYNNLDQLPVFNTYAMDEWGYFNGKTNYDLIEKPFDFYDQSQFPNATADRSPDYTYALKGLLSKIQYPTLGYDTIIYEGNILDGGIQPPSLVDVTKSVTGTGFDTQVTTTSNILSISYGQDAKLDYTVHDNSGDGSFDPLHNKGTVVFTDLTIGEDVYTDVLAPDNVLHSQVVYPVVGHTYQITVKANGTVVTTSATLHYRPGSSTILDSTPTGGVRVKAVKSYAAKDAVPVIKKYYYAYLDSLNKSSAWSAPDGYYLKTFHTRYRCYTDGTNEEFCQLTYCSYSAIFSTPQNSLNIFPGNITYQAVVEGFGDNFENGAIQHIYTIMFDVGPENMMSQFGGDLIPGTIFTNNSYYNGKELETKTFKNIDGQLIPVEKTEYTYKIDTSKSEDVVGCAVNKRYDYCEMLPTPPFVPADDINAFNAMRYYHESRWVYVDSVKETKYNDYGEPIMTRFQKNYYDNAVHMLPTRNKTQTSTGDIIVVQTKYSSDFGTLTGTSNTTKGIKNLNDKYILGAEIEKSFYKQDAQGNNQRLLNSKFTTYKASIPRPDTIFQIEQSSPITNFVNASNQSGNVVKDDRYKSQVDFQKYDSLGNIVQQQVENNIVISYIWDYQKLYPVAEAKNADSASIAFTSFEAGGKGNWSFTGTPVKDSTAITGRKAYVLNGSNGLTKSGLNSDVTYIVSYWTKNTSAFSITGTIAGYPIVGRTVSGWKYFEHRITGQTQVIISGSGSIDEVRLYPLAAQMITYTFDPLIGMTSQCDANNRITYYEYDGLSRLSIVRDQDRNIIKKICYNHAGQQEACGVTIFYSVEKSGSFIRNNCNTGGTGDTVAYIVPAHTYVSTVSQEAADLLAQNDVDANGQAYANLHGACTFYNVQKSGNFSRNNCGTGYTGSTVTYTVAANTYSSTTSQSAADQLAQDDVDTNGQSYANSHGTCTVTCNTTNCTGNDKKCINNICETGVKVYTGSTLIHANIYSCTYHYEWSDGSWSQDFTETHTGPCPID